MEKGPPVAGKWAGRHASPFLLDLACHPCERGGRQDPPPRAAAPPDRSPATGHCFFSALSSGCHSSSGSMRSIRLQPRKLSSTS